MNPAEIKATCLFFFLGMLDEYRAIEAANKAVSLYYKRIHENPDQNRSALFVRVTHLIWSKQRGHQYRGKPNYSNNSGWTLPQGFDFGPWKEFQKLAQEEELLSVIWSKVLGIADADIAEGEEVTEGTLRYRLGKGLRKLGAYAGENRLLGVIARHER